MTGHRLFGLETEYAVAALDARGGLLDRGVFTGHLLTAASTMLPNLPGSIESGLFLSNGSRLYVDVGDHPELAGPECVDPWDAVRYLRAGDRIVTRLADHVRRQWPTVAETRIFTGNVDYSGSGTTWGAHESYCHRAHPDRLQRLLIPHLVSRVIYCGAGGFNPLSNGLEFTLSPRAHHLGVPVSNESTQSRGIAHTRQESHSGHGYRRQHLLCGENLRSDLATWLKVGATALVVAIIEAGVTELGEVQLASPVAALHAIAKDPSLTTRVGTTAGEHLTAIDIQRRLLGHAQRHLRAAFMPSWAGAVCAGWERLLDRLAAGPDAVCLTLDWAMKLAMYRDRTRRRGLEWDSLAAWSQVPHQAGRPDVDRFLALRDELLEIDTRWGLLGADGIFSQLEQAGVVDHHVDGVDAIETAMTVPPSEGRARIRGMVVHRVFGERALFACGWDHVWDRRTGSRLDLSDPFAAVERWSAPKRTREAAASPQQPANEDPSIWDELNSLLARVRPRARWRRDPEAAAAPDARAVRAARGTRGT